MIEFLMIQGGILGQTELTPADKLVVSYLAFRQGTNGTCWPPVELIAGELALSRSTVKRSVAKLTRRGYLVKYQVNGGKFQSNNYLVRTEYLKRGAAAPDLDQAPAVRADDSLFKASHRYEQSVRERRLSRIDKPLRAQRTRSRGPLTYFGYIVPDLTTWKTLHELHRAGQWNQIKEIQKGLKRVDESEAQTG
jgi:hypothetical protein